MVRLTQTLDLPGNACLPVLEKNLRIFTLTVLPTFFWKIKNLLSGENQLLKYAGIENFMYSRHFLKFQSFLNAVEAFSCR